MYYRAIKMKNGGEEVEFSHFMTLFRAYTWLLPSEEEEEKDDWHIKPFPVILDATRPWQFSDIRGCHVEVMGFTDKNRETTHYIQYVDGWQDALPKF